MSTYYVQKLPEVDQQCIKRGVCPWCLNKLNPGGLVNADDDDFCAECGDEFPGYLTIED